MNQQNFNEQFCLNSDIYLLNHSVGKLPRSTRGMFEQQFFSSWEDSDGDPWQHWFSIIEGFQQALASLFNAQAHELCPQTNISSALCKLLGSLQARPAKNVLLYNENDFPSVGFVIQKARALGFTPKAISNELNSQDIQVWSDHLTDDVAAVLIAHVHYNTSQLVPVEEITRLCREREIFSIVDIAQSAGIVPIDIKRWSADALIGSSVKWLCGGPGAAFLWIDDETVEKLTPLDVGWFSHATPFEFDIKHFEYHRTALRFWGGTPSVAPFCIAANGINEITQIGIDKIRQHNYRLTQQLIESIEESEHHLNTPSPHNLRGGTLVIQLEDRNKEAICHRLTELNIKFDSRALGIRVSPHIYNTNEEISVLRRALET